MFDRLIVGVLTNSVKSCSFSADERVEFIKMAAGHLPNVAAEQFSGLLVDFVKKKEASVIIKGLRAISDFESEFQMALVNKNQLPEVETIFIPTSTEYMFLSSSVVKELARYNGKLDGLVPKEIQSNLYNTLG
jgi:pantetheine-phosphate adenylyltransferase